MREREETEMRERDLYTAPHSWQQERETERKERGFTERERDKDRIERDREEGGTT